ncbi:hypothetical protein Hamer_G005129 [Homarus americanus]|uniref:Uncharacterized protein n=1 Tax=Homarus americanus TaxID=6706 RepID=A0A8J5JYC7_HOMAM|nr:hypothetical protein Hamer_G005129 [Homarus americanus]
MHGCHCVQIRKRMALLQTDKEKTLHLHRTIHIWWAKMASPVGSQSVPGVELKFLIRPTCGSTNITFG